MGALGPVMMFLFTLVAVIIVGLYTFFYIAWVLREVVEAVAAGNREMTWADEPLPDRIQRALPLLGVLVIWLMPSAIVAQSLRNVFLPRDANIRFLVFALPGVWLLFPVGILSSLTSNSQGTIGRPAVVVQMLRLFVSSAVFYLLTGVGSVLVVFVWILVLQGQYVLMLVAVPVSAAFLLVYGRLLGRLAWLIGKLEPWKSKKKSRPAHKENEEPPHEEDVEVHDPWDAPEEPKPKKRKKRKREESRFGEEDVYGVGTGWQAEPTPEGDQPEPATSTPKIREPKAKPPKPKRERAPNRPKVVSLFRGTFSFPLQSSNRKVLIALNTAFAVLGGLLLLLQSVFPF